MSTEVILVVLFLSLAITSAAAVALPQSPGTIQSPPLLSTQAAQYLCEFSKVSPDTSTPNTTVSWQSIFWALLALALNAMTQPSVLDLEFPQSSLLFPSRSSAFVCVADALDVLVELFAHLCNGRNIRESVYQVNLGRLHHRLGQNTVPLTPTAVEQHPKCSLVLFLGTMSQFVKLCSFRGIFWAKVGAGMYLVSYVVLASASWVSRDFARRADHLHSPIIGSQRVRYIRVVLFVVAAVAHFLFCCWTIFQMLGAPNLSSDISFLRYVALAPWIIFSAVIFILSAFGLAFMLIFLCLCLIFNLLHKMAIVGDAIAQKFRLWRPFLSAIFGYLGTLSLFCICMSSDPDHGFDPYGLETWWSCGAAALFLGIGAWIILAEMISWICSRVSLLKRWQPKLGQGFYLMTFASMNLVMVCLYYSIAYSAEGTVKPAWAEKLG